MMKKWFGALFEWYRTQLDRERHEPKSVLLDACVLEDRVLYSATAFPIDLQDADHQNASLVSLEEVDALLQLLDDELNGATDWNESPAATASDQPIAILPTEVVPASSSTPEHQRAVAFVDAGLDDLDGLIAQLQADLSDDQRTLEVVLLDRTTSGVQQIGQHLAAAEFDYSAVHLITHGGSGQFQLGSDWLNITNLNEYSQQIVLWQDGLTDDADLLIYGCQVASTSDGQQLGLELSDLLRVDVAMSTDGTGLSTLGGDWDLEFRTGMIETKNQVIVDAADEWQGMLATYTVTNTNDTGAGSLRQAITDANNNAGTDTIQFSVGSGVISINLASALPTITGTVIIDGWTQPGYSSTPIVVIDGGNHTGDGLVLTSSADNSTIRGLVIRDFIGDGIQIDFGSTGNTIVGNYIGSFATSGGNLGSGEANSGNGINVLGANNIIGGTTAQLRNVIGGNLSHGILLTGSGASGNSILGNYIGTDATGNTVMANSLDGVHIASGANTNTIGGVTTSARNVIAGNTLDGIQIDGESSDSNVIRNNYIGLGANGTNAIGNGDDGIYISGGADNTVIGGASMENVILGNRIVGIEVDGASTGTVIQGNYIGINLTGTLVQGNGQSGIILENGTSNTTVGGTNTGEGNVITDNGLMSSTYNAGIQVIGSSTGNSIFGNSIYDNRGLGIDLGTAGVTANDSVDGDTGPNNLQNFPTLSASSVNAAGTTVTVSGSINSSANVTGMLLHFYATPSSGNVNLRQGRRYLGSTTVNTDASGNSTFTNINLTGYTGTVAAGELITATATTPGTNGNTSEFSLGMVATSSTGNLAPTGSQVVSTVDGGLTINNSGYSTYLEVEDGSSLLGGRTQLSLEFQIRGTAMVTDDQYSLISYVTPTDGDSLYIGAYKSGGSEAIGFVINGLYVETAYDVDALFDGNLHSFALTWTQTSGAWAMYVDGIAIGSGTGHASGQSLGSGGQLAVGIDLDSGSDSWQRAGLFKGTFYDVRLFSDVRTATEIATSYRSNLPFNEGNMIANWKFDDLSSAMITTSSVSGNDLLVRSVTQSGFSADTPGLELRLDENSATGTIAGAVLGIDIEREARISALLAADSSLRYNAETGKFYKLVSGSAVTWSQAQSGAVASTLNGVTGELATIHSAGENAFLASFNASAFIGGADSVVEGQWRWYSGSTAGNVFWRGNASGFANNGAYTNFDTSQPDDFNGVQDQLMLLANGKWDDIDASSTDTEYWVQWNVDDVLDATNALTYTITTQTVAGAFAINSDTGVITVANGALLNFETQSSHTITVRTTDGSGASFDKNYTISLNNLTEENNAPNDLSSGINLNMDGGNNAYLMTSSGGSVFGGRTALTVEVIYSINSSASNENPLISYAVAGADNEVYVRVTPSGALSFAVNNVAAVSTSAFAQLVDGKQHAVAVSWDNTAGDVRFYIDGQLVHTATGVKVGTTLQSGGTLVIGQDQDSVNGGYNATQRFSGTIYDVRVWDRAISDEQISQNYQQVPGATETGLVANWRMSGISGGTTVNDSVGGVNFTLANVAVGGSFTASTTTAGMTVSENVSAGTRVGQVIAADPDVSRDVVLDGLFREAGNPGTFTTYTAGQSIGNWTVQSGDVDLTGTTWQSSPLGGRSIDLNGNNPGAISQTLTTVAGRQYQIVFNVSGNWNAGDATKDFRLSVGGTSQDFSVAQPNGWSYSNMLFSGRSMTFTAAGGSTTLAFQSLDSGNSGAVIADVRVIEIPQAVQVLLGSDSTLSYDAATGKFYKTVALRLCGRRRIFNSSL